MPGQEGAYAEKIAINAAIVARKPESLVARRGGSAGADRPHRALRASRTRCSCKPGETILIQGGAGGVASFAIQLAKHIGARVITTASAANHDYLRRLGADQIIDYNAQDFTKVVSGCDAVFDTVGGDVAKRSFAVLQAGRARGVHRLGYAAPASPRADVESLRPQSGATARISSASSRCHRRRRPRAGDHSSITLSKRPQPTR